MQKQSLNFSSPYLNAAGSLGFAPDPRGPIDPNRLGAFITNPISLRPRKAANGPRLIHYAEGAMFHTGHPNPGIKSTLNSYQSVWARSGVPIIVHLLGAAPEEISRMVQLLEEVENVAGIEIGLRHDADENITKEIIASALGELPIMARVSLSNAVEIGIIAYEAGASLVSIGPPRGDLKLPTGEMISGRLYGSDQFPDVLAAAEKLVTMKIPVVGGGGVYEQDQVKELLDAGAVGVQLDTILWKGDFFEND